MIFIASRLLLKPGFPATPCWHESIRCSRPLLRQTNSWTVTVRCATTKAPGKGQSASTPTLSKKPPHASIPSKIQPLASELREAERNEKALGLARGGKALLYKAPSYAGFTSMAWFAGAACIGSALVLAKMGMLGENQELPWFVPGTYRVVAVLLVALGCFSISRSFRLISSIEILARNDKAMLLLKVRPNIPLPFIKPKHMALHLSDVAFRHRMAAEIGQPVPDASSSGMARRISIALFRFFVGVRQFMNSDGLAHLYVNGYTGTWKLDVKGFFLDGGRPLFDLVKFTT